MRCTKLLLLLLPFALVTSLPSVADSCNPFNHYRCQGQVPNAMDLVGTGKSGQLVGVLLGNSFSVAFDGHRNVSGDDLIILAAAPNGLTGSLNGDSFTHLTTFPEGGAPAAIRSTWTGMGIVFKAPAFGYVNLGPIGSTPFSIMASGVGKGTIFYAELVNPKNNKILFITPNAEAGILGGGTAATPEPASLTLLGTGLVGLAGLVHRKTRKS